MPYIKKTWVAGKTVDVEKHYSGRYGKKTKRGAKRAPTTEEQKAINYKRAVEHLRRILNANFAGGDWHMVLTYGKEYAPPTPQEARRDRERFLRAYREWCQKEGMPVRYVAVTEYKAKRIHHHLVLKAIPHRVLTELWTYGRPHITPLDNSGDYRELAEYLIKETERTFREEGAAQRKRWTQSKGLIIPQPKVEIIKAETWRDDPKPPKNHILMRDTLQLGVDPFTGQPWQRYTLLRTDGGGENDARRRRTAAAP